MTPGMIDDDDDDDDDDDELDDFIKLHSGKLT